MLGRGSAPKDPWRRRRGVAGLRGEWQELPSAAWMTRRSRLVVAIWPPRTRAEWESWWADPVSVMWSPADRGSVVELGWSHATMVTMRRPGLASEVRLRMDALGVTQKGRRELMWRDASRRRFRCRRMSWRRLGGRSSGGTGY